MAARKKSKPVKNITDLSRDPQNANKGTERGRSMLERSLKETGAGRSILVDKNGSVIAGNKTLEAWGEIAEDVEVVHTDGQKLVVVQRDDLDLVDDDGQARRLAFLDNRTSEVDINWDVSQIVSNIDAGFNFDGIFSQDELSELLGELTEDVEFPEYDESVENDVKYTECPECGHKFPQ